MLFADICGSTALYNKLGDEKALYLVKSLLQKCEEIALRFSGSVVKTIGDEIMLYFPDAFNTVSAAIEMQLMTEDFSAREDYALFLRIGLNAGELQHENNDIFGNTVNMAARFADFASAGKIITSKELLDGLAGKGGFEYREIGVHKFKGMTEPVECCEVIAEAASLTMIRPASTLPASCTLQLETCTKSVLLEGSGSVTIGRGHDNNIQIESPSVSRSHAVIEGRYTSFSLSDQSTNGTFIIKPGSPPIRLHHETYILTGEGTLVMGQAEDNEGTATIKFRIMNNG